MKTQKYAPLVKAYYPNARCEEQHFMDRVKIFYVTIPQFPDIPASGALLIIGRGRIPWTAWKNAMWYVNRRAMEKLEI